MLPQVKTLSKQQNAVLILNSKKSAYTLKTLFQGLMRRIDHFIDNLRFRLVKTAGVEKKLPIKIVTYRGFGRPDCLFVQGRVLVKKSLRHLPPVWRALINTYYKGDGSETPNAVLRISIADQKFDLITDQEGYFTLNAQLNPALVLPDKDPWQKIHIELLGTPWTKDLHLSTSTKVLIPSPTVSLGIISDIDDTIIHTGVTSMLKWQVFYNTFFKSAAKRKAFEEVAAFFRELRKGASGKGFNPIFYVSNSPRNIYDLVKSYLKIHNLPKGPLLLKDIGWPYKLHTHPYQNHKMDSIIRLLEIYPDLKFILIGDSGEKDPFLYHEIDQKYPGRIAAIYIRDVQDARRRRNVLKFLEEKNAQQVQLFQSYRQLAEMASAQGFLNWERFVTLAEKPKEVKGNR
jgi:phosphatidate phosphatase APP1